MILVALQNRLYRMNCYQSVMVIVKTASTQTTIIMGGQKPQVQPGLDIRSSRSTARAKKQGCKARAVPTQLWPPATRTRQSSHVLVVNNMEGNGERG
jgi:hypothetical protein